MMDNKIKEQYIIFIYISLAATLVYLGCKFSNHLWLLLLLVGSCALLVTLRHTILFNRLGQWYSLILIYLPDAVLAFLVGLFISIDGATVIYLIILCDACLFCPRLTGYILACLCSLVYTFFVFFHSSSRQTGTDYISDIAFMGGAFLSVLALTALVRQEAEARQNSKRMFYELKTKSKQLEDFYCKLKEAAVMQEKMAVLQERVRLSRDMHDTVGHALTNGLFTIEAAEKLIESGQKDAAVKISLAKEQLRKGLAELRKTVSTIAIEPSGFLESFRSLLENMRRQGFSVYEDIEKPPELGTRQQTALLRALQEGLTNGVKHGHSTAFVVRLAEDSGNVRFSLEDNGAGCEKLMPGFGLKSMKQRVIDAGGSLRTEARPGKGFLIEIILPVKGTVNETNTYSDC